MADSRTPYALEARVLSSLVHPGIPVVSGYLFHSASDPRFSRLIIVVADCSYLKLEVIRGTRVGERFHASETCIRPVVKGQEERRSNS